MGELVLSGPTATNDDMVSCPVEGGPQADDDHPSLHLPRPAPVIPSIPDPDWVMVRQLVEQMFADAHLQQQQQERDIEVVLLWLKRQVGWLRPDLTPQQRIQQKEEGLLWLERVQQHTQHFSLEEMHREYSRLLEQMAARNLQVWYRG